MPTCRNASEVVRIGLQSLPGCALAVSLTVKISHSPSAVGYWPSQVINQRL